MAIVFHIPGPLQFLTVGRRTVEVEGSPATVREALELLGVRYPGIRDRVFTEQSEIREHVNVFLGNEEIRHLDGVATRLTDETEITIMQAVSGGS
jgi:molybdopterin converting factor small subunit